MRLWGGSEPEVDPNAEAQEDRGTSQSEAPKPSAQEAMVLGMLGKMPGVGEALKGLLGMAQHFAAQQEAMAKDVAFIKAWIIAQDMRQKGQTHVPIEGVIADGIRCAICGSTGACDCYAEVSAPGDNELPHGAQDNG